MLYTNAEIQKRRNRDEKIRKIVTNVMYIILIPILIYNVSLIFQTIINTNKTPSFFGIKTYVIVSGSMKPNINIGDIVIVKNIEDKEDIKIGDVISFRKGQSIITHRITNIQYDENQTIKITTKGDNNNTEDSEEISYDDIEGKVIKIIPKLGNISLAMQNKIIIIVVIILFYMYLSRNYKINRRKTARKLKKLEYEKRKNIER